MMLILKSLINLSISFCVVRVQIKLFPIIYDKLQYIQLLNIITSIILTMKSKVWNFENRW